MDAVEKIQELMATGNYRDPIAERKAKEEAEPVAEESTETDGESTADDISFDDL